MTFENFNNNISKIKDFPLPGLPSQAKLSPPFRKELLEEFKSLSATAKKAGVMALFYPDEEDICKLCLILRKTYKGVHSAQVGFPGGRFEFEDQSLLETALRETEEEVGINRETISVIREMSEIYIPPSNFLVYPFLGLVSKRPQYILQESEVEAVIEANLSELLDENSISDISVLTSMGKDVPVPAFTLSGHVVWGATAMMLGEIKDLIKQSI
ncbi:8-oxo-dGTP pyrophosphatase MutT, NUDIX family [Flavobacteriaceae bacterium MAR_2010_188]|nr:8-oxo-dGTP pyrophosphatase MutT, NUDIX family [Flavobacteriaceae bacterium MAR_2010_188]